MKTVKQILKGYFNAMKNAESLYLANPSDDTRAAFMMAMGNYKTIKGIYTAK